MRKLKSFAMIVFATLVFAGVQTAALGQTANDGNLANMSGGGSSMRWNVVAPNTGGKLTITAPDGRVFYREFKSGGSPEFTLGDRQLEGLPDGAYSYELRLRPALSAGEREALKTARGKDDDPEAERAGRKRPVVPVLVQSGSFSILNGAIIIGGAVEGERTAKAAKAQASPISANTINRLRNHRLSLFSIPDQVIADDLIVQGSICAGLDCVNNENFGFDTIRLKENNTRLQFDDTSVSPFPTNNWQIRANSSVSGGASFLAFVDQGAAGNSETGTIVFEVDAGAPANSLRVSSVGKVGVRTGTPVLDLHVNSSDTPAIRLEQNNSGGFTAQTWDIAGNEANFFVRDVTGGSRLPLRIRPGAPTSSLDISADGDIGIGTGSPNAKVEVVVGAIADGVRLTGTTVGTLSPSFSLFDSATQRGALGLAEAAGHFSSSAAVGDIVFQATTGKLLLQSSTGAAAITVTTANNVGIGTTTPDQKFSVNGDASKTGGNTWLAFSDERLKTIKGRFNTGLKAVMQLQPIRYEYLKNNALGLKSEGEHVGFGAQTLQKVIPEAVVKNADGYLMVNSDPIIWTMLNAIKEQQKEIAELKAEVQKLRATSHRRRR